MTYTQDTIEAIAQRTLAQYPSFFFTDGDRHDIIQAQRKYQLALITKDLVRDMNGCCGSRCRKSLATLCDILSARGIRWESDIPMYLTVWVGESTVQVRYLGGIEIALDCCDSLHGLEFGHCTSRESDIADLIECIAAADRASRLLAEKRFQEADRNRMISEVEFPGVEKEVADFLVPKGIRYTLENCHGQNVLSVQIIKEVWMRKAISYESLWRDLQLIPYLILRPDCIKRDGRGFYIFHNWGWDRK